MARQFSNTSDNSGLIQLCEQNIFGDTGFGQISNNVQRLQQMTNNINEAYSSYFTIATQSDGKWQFDDSNYTDYPFAITNIVANQEDYTFLVSMVNILAVEIMNAGGVWYTLSEVDIQELSNDHISMSQRFLIPSQPNFFARTANSIFLLPAPNYAMTGGIKVKYQRPPSYFSYTDTTKTPGFTDVMHEYLSDYASWKYCLTHDMSLATGLSALKANWEQVKIPTLYAKREKDFTKNLFPRYTNRR